MNNKEHLYASLEYLTNTATYGFITILYTYTFEFKAFN